MTKKVKSTKVKTTRVKSDYDKFMETLTPKELEKYKQEYKEFLLSEMVLAAMEEDDISVRKLAKAAGVSPTVVQGIRSGNNQNITMNSFVKILSALGCSIVIEKNGNRIPLDLHHHIDNVLINEKLRK